MASIEPGANPVLTGLSEEPMRRSVAERFGLTAPTLPIAGCGPGRTLELGCFFDGTRNNRWQLAEGASVTNVVRLHDAYVTGPRANGAAERDKHYLIGVGAGTGPAGQPTVGTNIYAAATGFGGKFRVNMMYDWVKAKIEAHSRIFAPGSLKLIDVFGFSRGALSARTFVNLVNQALKTEPGPAFQNIELRFLGVFDTVESLHEFAEAPNCHVTNSDYRAARQFTARHEIRSNFPLTLLDPGAQSVEYPGEHSDVGGGWADGVQNRPNWLSFVTLVDMRAACRAQGIDTQKIDQLWATDGVSSDKGTRFGDLVRATLARAKEDQKDSAADLSFRVQVMANEYTHSEEAASRLMKNEHDAYMAVIKNISG